MIDDLSKLRRDRGEPTKGYDLAIRRFDPTSNPDIAFTSIDGRDAGEWLVEASIDVQRSLIMCNRWARARLAQAAAKLPVCVVSVDLEGKVRVTLEHTLFEKQKDRDWLLHCLTVTAADAAGDAFAETDRITAEQVANDD